MAKAITPLSVSTESTTTTTTTTTTPTSSASTAEPISPRTQQQLQQQRENNTQELFRKLGELWSNKDTRDSTKDTRDSTRLEEEVGKYVYKPLDSGCTGKNGNTILHFAVLCRHSDLVNHIILTNPELLGVKNMAGQTPVDIFEAIKSQIIAKEKLNATFGYMALEGVVEAAQCKKIEEFLKQGQKALTPGTDIRTISTASTDDHGTPDSRLFPDPSSKEHKGITPKSPKHPFHSKSLAGLDFSKFNLSPKNSGSDNDGSFRGRASSDAPTSSTPKDPAPPTFPKKAGIFSFNNITRDRASSDVGTSSTPKDKDTGTTSPKKFAILTPSTPKDKDTSTPKDPASHTSPKKGIFSFLEQHPEVPGIPKVPLNGLGITGEIPEE